MVAPEEPVKMAAALRRLLDDEYLRCCMGAAGRRRVLSLFTREKMVLGNLDVYEAALKSLA